MRALATWSFRHRKLVLAGWLLVVAGIFMSSLAAGTRYSSSFSLPNTDSTKALNLLQADAPAQSGDTEQVVVASASGATLTTPAVHAQVNALLAKLATLPDVKSVVSPYSTAGRAQMNASHTVAFANLNYGKVGNQILQLAGPATGQHGTVVRHPPADCRRRRSGGGQCHRSLARRGVLRRHRGRGGVVLGVRVAPGHDPAAAVRGTGPVRFSGRHRPALARDRDRGFHHPAGAADRARRRRGLCAVHRDPLPPGTAGRP